MSACTLAALGAAGASSMGVPMRWSCHSDKERFPPAMPKEEALADALERRERPPPPPPPPLLAPPLLLVPAPFLAG